MTQRNMLRTTFLIAVTVWAGIFAFLSLRPTGNDGVLPTRAALPQAAAVAASPTEQQPTPLPTLTGMSVVSQPATQPAIPTLLPTQTIAPTQESVEEAEVVDDQIIIQFAPETTAEERAAQIASIGGTIQGEISALDAVVISVENPGVLEMLPQTVVSAEPNYTVYAQYDFNNPVSDPFIGQQWALNVTGVKDVWNDVPETSITVAVIDSGVCAAHPDLAGRLLPGWDYVQDDADPDDVYGHGCGVASVIAANIDNSAGMAGIAPNAIILPLRVLNASGSGSYADVAQAIIDATDQGANVINLSLGGTAASITLQNAVRYADSRGVIVVAAAGNDGANRELYPAAYAEVISVGALDQNLNRASFSNYGSGIDVWAPGVNIVTAYLGNSYAMQNGTSFATPIVAGIAAMELALGRELDLSGDVIFIDPVLPDIIEAPTETPTNTTVPPVPPQNRETLPPGTVPTAQPPSPTNLWAVRLAPGSDPVQTAASLGFEYVGPVGLLANTYLFRLPGSEEQTALAASAASALASSPQVENSQQQFLYQAAPDTIPSEPGLSNQWHLDNSGQSGGTAGVDANVFAAWQIPLGGGDFIDGEGVVIAIVDDALQYTHPDIAPNYVASASYDMFDNDLDPLPESSGEAHGTSVGGVAAGADDGSCGLGAAYAAGISGLRLLGGTGSITDWTVSNAENYAYNTNDIYNNSWGFNLMVYPDEFWLTRDALELGTTNGRNGLGNIYTWSSGNDFSSYDQFYNQYIYYRYNVNNDWPANSRYTIAVGAVNHDGQRSYYSTPGAALVVSAPSSGSESGIYTTDLTGVQGYSLSNCTGNFGGTSSAAPLVAGVIGLMLEANPDLGWRDVQHILAETSVTVDPNDQDLVSNWTTNAAGYTHSDSYGFGMIDAEAAVTAALSWENVPPEMFVQSGTVNVSQAIPNGYGSHNLWGPNNYESYGGAITSTVNIPENLIIEHVEVVFNATHSFREELRVTLTSPQGTQSVLTNPHYFKFYDARYPEWVADYLDWTFMTVRNWGEMSAGTWTIRVEDAYAGDSGTFNSWSLRIYGRIPEPTDFTAAIASNTQIDLSWDYAGPQPVDLILEISDDGIDWTESETIAGTATSYSYAIPSCNATYLFRLRAEHQTFTAYSNYTPVEEAYCDPFDHLVSADDLGSTVPANATYDTTGFSPGSDPLPSCGYGATRTIWYTFTPAQSGTYSLTTAGSAINTVLSIWEDDGGMAEIGCDDDSGTGNSAMLMRPLTAGTTYYLTVAGNNNAGGEIMLNIDKLPDPTDTPEPTTVPPPTAIPTPVQSTVGLVNPGNALWSFRDSNDSGWADLQFAFGPQTDDWKPVVGDWNGDGIDGIGVYRQGVWLLRETTDGGSYDTVVHFGNAEAGWQPISGDWNGDEIDGIGLYRAGTWLLRNHAEATGYDVVLSFERFGGSGTAIAGDWNNDGFDSPGLFHNGSWALRQTNEPQSGVVNFQFGSTGTPWQPIIGDWDTDGYDTAGIFYQGIWYLTNDTMNPALDATFNFGMNGIPVANYRGGMGGLMALSQPPAPVQPPAPTVTMAPPTLTFTPTSQPLAVSPTPETTEASSPTWTPTPLPPTPTLAPSATSAPALPSPEATAEVTQEP